MDRLSWARESEVLSSSLWRRSAARAAGDSGWRASASWAPRQVSAARSHAAAPPTGSANCGASSATPMPMPAGMAATTTSQTKMRRRKGRATGLS